MTQNKNEKYQSKTDNNIIHSKQLQPNNNLNSKLLYSRIRKNGTIDKKLKILTIHNNSIGTNFFFNPLKNSKKEISTFTMDKNKIKIKGNMNVTPDSKRLLRSNGSNHGIKITKDIKNNNVKNMQMINYKDKNDGEEENITERKTIDLTKKNIIKLDNSIKRKSQKDIIHQNQNKNPMKKKDLNTIINNKNKKIKYNIIRNTIIHKNKKQENQEINDDKEINKVDNNKDNEEENNENNKDIKEKEKEEIYNEDNYSYQKSEDVEDSEESEESEEDNEESNEEENSESKEEGKISEDIIIKDTNNNDDNNNLKEENDINDKKEENEEIIQIMK